MTLRIQCITVDAEDPQRLGGFWERALGWHRVVDTVDEVVLRPGAEDEAGDDGPDLLFLRLPDRKRGKNRLHLDLRPDDQTLEIERVRRLGAQPVEIGQRGDESWVVLADPEGNEFCVLRPLRAGDQVYEGAPS